MDERGVTLRELLPALVLADVLPSFPTAAERGGAHGPKSDLSAGTQVRGTEITER